MNRLEVQSRVDPSLNGVVTELLVDGQLLSDFKKDSLSVDLSALKTATEQSGDFYIVTCICGYPSCAGIKQGIRIDHIGGCVYWVGRILDETQTFTFGLEEFRIAVKHGIEQLKRLLERYDLEVAPEIMELAFGSAEDAR